jgi:phosphoribosylformylglycinamidine (FGAM) synthase-like enzyme
MAETPNNFFELVNVQDDDSTCAYKSLEYWIKSLETSQSLRARALFQKFADNADFVQTMKTWSSIMKIWATY